MNNEEKKEFSRDQIEKFIFDRMYVVCRHMGMNVYLKEQKTRQFILEELRKTSEKFVFLELSKILIPNPDSITIYSLREYLSKDEHIIFNKWKGKIDFEILRESRNNLVAHYDKNIFDNTSDTISSNINLNLIEFKTLKEIVENTVKILIGIAGSDGDNFTKSFEFGYNEMSCFKFEKSISIPKHQ